MRRLTALVVLPLSLAACSPNGTGGGGSPSPSPSPSSYATAKDLAEKFGCRDLSPHSGVLYEKDAVSCRLGSVDGLQVVIFEDSKARDSWLQIAKAFGTTNVVLGDRWIVASPDMATAAVVKTATGGTDG